MYCLNPKSSSLYSCPRLLEMKIEKAATRARFYKFLRGIGIVPDGLDGLEIPVTTEFMRESGFSSHINTYN